MVILVSHSSKMKKLIILPILLFLFVTANAQIHTIKTSNNIDSLLGVWNSDTSDNLNKAFALDQIVRYYILNNSKPVQNNRNNAAQYLYHYEQLADKLQDEYIKNRFIYRKTIFKYSINYHIGDTLNIYNAFHYFKEHEPDFAIYLAKRVCEHADTCFEWERSIDPRRTERLVRFEEGWLHRYAAISLTHEKYDHAIYAYSLLASLYNRTKAYDKAIANCLKTIELDKTYAECKCIAVLNTLTNALFEKGDKLEIEKVRKEIEPNEEWLTFFDNNLESLKKRLEEQEARKKARRVHVYAEAKIALGIVTKTDEAARVEKVKAEKDSVEYAVTESIQNVEEAYSVEEVVEATDIGEENMDYYSPEHILPPEVQKFLERDPEVVLPSPEEIEAYEASFVRKKTEEELFEEYLSLVKGGYFEYKIGFPHVAFFRYSRAMLIDSTDELIKAKWDELVLINNNLRQKSDQIFKALGVEKTINLFFLDESGSYDNSRIYTDVFMNDNLEQNNFKVTRGMKKAAQILDEMEPIYFHKVATILLKEGKYDEAAFLYTLGDMRKAYLNSKMQESNDTYLELQSYIVPNFRYGTKHIISIQTNVKKYQSCLQAVVDYARDNDFVYYSKENNPLAYDQGLKNYLAEADGIASNGALNKEFTSLAAKSKKRLESFYEESLNETPVYQQPDNFSLFGDWYACIPFIYHSKTPVFLDSFESYDEYSIAYDNANKHTDTTFFTFNLNHTAHLPNFLGELGGDNLIHPLSTGYQHVQEAAENWYEEEAEAKWVVIDPYYTLEEVKKGLKRSKKYLDYTYTFNNEATYSELKVENYYGDPEATQFISNFPIQSKNFMKSAQTEYSLMQFDKKLVVKWVDENTIHIGLPYSNNPEKINGNPLELKRVIP